jgi:hypothetical protein
MDLFKVLKLRRDNSLRSISETQDSRDHGRKFKGRKPLKTDKIFQVGRSLKLQRRSNSNSQIGCNENLGPLDQCLANKDSTGKENRSHPLDLSREGQHPLDLDAKCYH